MSATPCQGRPEWTSDLPEDRHAAAQACLTECTARSACARAALDLPVATWGVWAGVDLSLHVSDGRGARQHRITKLRTLANHQETA